jgi:hypothetical protein
VDLPYIPLPELGWVRNRLRNWPRGLKILFDSNKDGAIPGHLLSTKVRFVTSNFIALNHKIDTSFSVSMMDGTLFDKLVGFTSNFKIPEVDP